MAKTLIAYRKEAHVVNGRIVGYYEHRDYVDRPDPPTVAHGGPSSRSTGTAVAPVVMAAIVARPCRGCGQATCQCPPPAPDAARYLAAFQRKAAQQQDAGVPVPPEVPVPAGCTMCHDVTCRCQDMLGQVVALQKTLGRRG